MRYIKSLLLGCVFVLGASGCTKKLEVSPLSYEVYNAGEENRFSTSSTLLYSDKEVFLIDAQFSEEDAQYIIDKIESTGKSLAAIYISHPEADFYFGLAAFKAAFPQVKVLSTPQIVKAIKEKNKAQLAFWRKVASDDVPDSIIVPEALETRSLLFAGNEIDIKGIDTDSSVNSYLWIPALKMMTGGDLTFSGMHPRLGESAKNKEKRQAWIQELEKVMALQPQIVIPSHFIGEMPKGAEALQFSRDYLAVYDKLVETQDNAKRVKAILKKLHPTLKGLDNLEANLKGLKADLAAAR